VSELLIGCGSNLIKALSFGENTDWTDLTTLDREASHGPDVLHDLETLPYPFEDAQFDEIHAYDVLEHVGAQGNWRFFFVQWGEFHRILKPQGLFFGVVPHPTSPWAWGDPSHTRVIPVQQLSFLSQRFYDQVGTSAASDWRSEWHGNFEIVQQCVTDDLRQVFVLQKTP
jgi:SAM-dependent methyltransferase